MLAQTVLTPTDLVILSVIIEAPRHGYDLKAELERREVRDWVTVSRPQVYYSLRKLADRNLIAPVSSAESGGPERQVYAITPEGQHELSQSLEREEWATSRPPPPILIWLALSSHADRDTRARVLEARATFIEDTIGKERQTLKDFGKHTGPMVAEGIMMVELAIAQLECERDWLKKVCRRLLRSAARGS